MMSLGLYNLLKKSLQFFRDITKRMVQRLEPQCVIDIKRRERPRLQQLIKKIIILTKKMVQRLGPQCMIDIKRLERLRLQELIKKLFILKMIANESFFHYITRAEEVQSILRDSVE